MCNNIPFNIITCSICEIKFCMNEETATDSVMKDVSTYSNYWDFDEVTFEVDSDISKQW